MRIIYFIVLISVGVSCFFKPSPLAKGDCPFCDSAVLDLQAFYEDDLILALCTHKPILPGHCLVIPKRHVERFERLSDAEVMQLGRIIRQVDRAAAKVFGTSSYLLLQKNGREVGQTVPHVHFHYVPRKVGDTSILAFILRMFIANARDPIPLEQIQKTVDEMRDAMAK